MLKNIFFNSFPVKIIFFLAKIYKYSVLHALLSVFSRAYANSSFKRFYEARMLAPSSGEGSLYWRMLNRLNLFVQEFARKVSPILNDSLLVMGLRGFASSSFVSNGIIDRYLIKPGLKKLIILMFALYLPIDHIFRSVGFLNVFASMWDEAFLIFGLFYTLARVASSRLPVYPRVTPLDIPILLFLTTGFFLMCVNAPIFGIAVSGYRAAAQYILWFFVISRLIEDESDLNYLVFPILAMGSLTALHGIYQFIIGVPIPAGWVSNTELGVRTRVFSIFNSPNIMGAFMVMTAPLAAAFAYKVKNTFLKVAFWALTGIICFSCLVTFSRGAWLGMAAAVLIFALLRDRRLIALIAIAVIVALFIPDIVNRITYLFTSDFAEASARAGRSGRWAIGIDLLVKNNPWLGFGQGRFGGAVAMQNQIIEGLDYFYMDNYYLKILIEMGYIGFASFIILIFSTAYNGMRSVFRAKASGKPDILIGIFSGLAGVLIHCLFENILEVPYMNAYFWGLAAALVAVGFNFSSPKVFSRKGRL